MPKITGHPLLKLDDCIKVAEKLFALGNRATMEAIADSLGQKPTSGALKQKISATMKYGLVEGKGELKLTALGESIVNPYGAEEKKESMLEAFLNPSTFKELFERFNGKTIHDITFLKTILIREYRIKPKLAIRAANSFLKSGTSAGVINKSKDGYRIGETDESKPLVSTIEMVPGRTKLTSSPQRNAITNDLFETIFLLGRLSKSVDLDPNEIEKLLENLSGACSKQLKYTPKFVNLTLEQFRHSKDIAIVRMGLDRIKQTLQEELGITKDELEESNK